MTSDRPRDRLGRPLPADAPADARGPGLPDVTGLDDAETWRIAWALNSEGLPFHAHEVCEERWRTCTPDFRDAWRALAQWGAAETHAARGNREGAHRLAERTLATLDHAPAVPAGIDVDEVRERCRLLLRD